VATDSEKDCRLMSFRGNPLALALALGSVVGVLVSSPGTANAQTAPSRDSAWGTASTVTAVTALGIETILPRIFYSDPEATVGWKTRWHVSVLAPTMTLTALGVFSHYAMKDQIKGERPGCGDQNRTLGDCATFGMPSTHSFIAMSALGQGTGVFLADTIKWSRGKINIGSIVGHVGVPLVLGTLTMVGRKASNEETGGQIIAGGTAGLLTGFGTGLLYAVMQRPECGYTGSLVCW
jgi:hypothetical protein